MKAIVFFRRNGTPDSRIMENDRDHDDIVRRIAYECEGANIIGIMDYEAASRWVLENMPVTLEEGITTGKTGLIKCYLYMGQPEYDYGVFEGKYLKRFGYKSTMGEAEFALIELGCEYVKIISYNPKEEGIFRLYSEITIEAP